MYQIIQKKLMSEFRDKFNDDKEYKRIYKKEMVILNNS